MVAIHFWFSIGSTYSYLSVMRLSDVEKTAGVEFRWQPFDVRYIMVEQDNIPFRNKPVKLAYMWRDIERRAAIYGLNPVLPAPYPLPGLVLANRVATVGVQEGWVREYTLATYRRWFELGQPAGEDPNLAETLSEIGQDRDRVLDKARSDDIGRALEEATVRAMSFGIFGSPSFAVSEEIFWGDDRLDDAVSWAKRIDAGPPSC